MDHASTSKNPVAASLAPGFRFHPTDEELIWYYLKRKVFGKAFRVDAISEIDVYKFEPWDLPGMSRLKTRDMEWYFFSYLDKKYGTSSRTNRATEKGYWKTTGKDRPVLHRSNTVGMKKTLVYHLGRAPRGERTNWVMHEYKLVGEEFEKNGKDACILCRIFQKSGPGPKNGEQYGAPLLEEEWEDDDLVVVPGMDFAEVVAVSDNAFPGDEAYLDEHDVEQILLPQVPSVNSSAPEENFSNTIIEPEQPPVEKLSDLSQQLDTQENSVKHEYMGESSKIANNNNLQGDGFLDASDIFQPDDGSFLETNDLLNHFDADPSGFDMIEEYLTYFNADEDFLSPMLADDNPLFGQSSFVQEPVDGEWKEQTEASQVSVIEPNNQHVDPFAEKYNPKMQLVNGVKYPTFMNEASKMLESFPAPPAFAAEFPTKLNSAAASASSSTSSVVRVTTGIIQINAMSSDDGSYENWSLEKQQTTNVNILISFNLPQPLNQGKQQLTISSSNVGVFYLMFVWLIIISMSFKIGACIYSGKA
ncbi:NAC domain-containing protein 53-like isoform X2 [Impatiens glandulifera]|uniref:NAC domain-containing protein 53-like isoform X2 n=1 Tax=Impatiens glandulifera TaxID=253017 RepID=UPI001FB0A28D|nr:NAC domain-containing protein 53-like isoform X2 [Impatiens glandulifera]